MIIKLIRWVYIKIKSYATIILISVEKKCYMLDLGATTKSWEPFEDLPQGCAYNAMVYSEKVNRLYSINCERDRAGKNSWVGLR